MNGYQLTFFTQQDRRHNGKPLAHWVVEQARALGIHGATMIGASEGSVTAAGYIRPIFSTSQTSRSKS